MRKHSFSGPVVRALLLACASLTPLHAAVPNRIAQAVDDSARVALPNNISPRVKASTDLGEAPANQQLQTVTLRFNRTAAQQAALDQFLLDVQNPASPSYHQWLTPEQFAAQFGLSAADLARVASWLTSKGLTVTGTARGGTFITVTGTVGQFEQAFSTRIHSLDYKGEKRFANTTDPTLPAAISSVVGSITGLNDFKLKSHLRRLPQYTSSVSGVHFIAPGDFYTIYNVDPLLTSATPINGTGVTIAVMGQTDISLAQVANFRSASGLSTTNLPTVKLIGPDPGTSASDIDEAQLDVEWAGAVAPSAAILYVNSADVIDSSLTQAIDQNLAPIITISYGDCEVGFGSASLNMFNQLFQQANAQGQTIVGPAGDSGATDCDYDSSIASGGLAVDFPASSPYVTGLGGTMFGSTSSPQSTATAPESGSFWNAGNGNGGGSAVSYIPESVWNESATYGSLAAGGGGASAFFTKPYYQTGTGVPADASRDVPDLALGAAALHDPFLICSVDNFFTGCSNGYRDAAGYLDAIGGTSVATPSFAGILALVEQKIGSRIGNANPTIYALANNGTYAANVFHDIASGNNDSSCALGSLNCTVGTNGIGYIGFNAAAGYDLATGWGSVNAFYLVNDWSQVTPAISTGGSSLSSTTLTTSAFNVTIGTPIVLTATVASNPAGATTPTGTVQFLVDSVAVGGAVALTGGTASYTLSTTGLTSGVHAVTAAYSGSATYASSKATAQIDLTSTAAPDFTLSPTSANMTAHPGGASSPLTITVSSVNGFIGAVNFTASSTSQTLNAEYAFSVSPVNLTSGSSGTTQFILYAYNSSSTGQSKFGPIQTAANSTPSWYLATSGIAVAGLLMLTLPRRRRWAGLLAALVTVATLGASGCSGGTILSHGGTVSSSSAITVNAAPGVYPITITGYTSSGQAHDINVTFTVN
jgi:subtilase family serine protease